MQDSPDKCRWCGYRDGYVNRDHEPGIICDCCDNGCVPFNDYIRCPVVGHILSILGGGDLPDVFPRSHTPTGKGNIFYELKQIDLASYARRYTELQSAGLKAWRGRCPIHAEKTPSFYIYADPWRWYCYGCDRHGDITDLKYEIDQGRDAMLEVARGIAREYGIEIPDRNTTPIKDEGSIWRK